MVKQIENARKRIMRNREDVAGTGTSFFEKFKQIFNAM